MRVRFEAATIVTGALLLVMVGSLARSIAQARWTEGLEVLLPVAVVGVLLGLVLAGSSVNPVKAHLLGFLTGLLVISWQTGQLVDGPGVSALGRLFAVWGRFREWLAVVLEGGTSYDELLFVFTMGAIVWFLAYNSAWLVLRYGWVWWAILPIGLVMLVNLGYALRPNYQPFVAFLIASLLLMVQAHLWRSRARWQRLGLGQESRLMTKLLLLGGVVSILLVALAWRGPNRSLAVTARAAFDRAAQPWETVQDRWESAFAFLYPESGGVGQAVGIGGGFTSFENSFELGGPLRLGTRRVFTAQGEAGQYWRSVALDRYTGKGWSNAAADEDGPDVRSTARQAGTVEVRTRSLGQRTGERKLPDGVERVNQRVRMLLPLGRPIFAADAPIAVDRDAVWELPLVEREATVPVNGDLTAAQRQARGESLQSLRELLARIGPARVARASADEVVLRRARVSAPSASPTPGAVATGVAARDEARRSVRELRSEFEALREQGIEASYTYTPRARPVIEYAYTEPNQYDVLNLSSASPLEAGATYEVTSVVPDPTNRQLNAVDEPLPAWVEDRYLELPRSLPQRVRRLALELTEGADTQHEKAQAIERYLRSLKYREDMPITPADRDFVDYFLFDLREGYCTYYASTMAVMLRSVGVPARTVTGFAPGDWDPKLRQYVITEAQAHMWPQVYYPGYGWVNYEPTPIRDPLDRNPPAATRNEATPGDSRAGTADNLLQRLNEDGRPGLSPLQDTGLPAPVRFALTAAVAAAVLAGGIYVVSLIRLRGLRGAARHYAKLIHIGEVLGVRPAVAQTPNEYGSRMSQAVPAADSSVRRITREYVAEVFGRRAADEPALHGEWQRVASAAARGAPSRVAGGLRALVNRMRRG